MGFGVMSFTPAPETLFGANCECEITLDKYRRKIPRCDDCETTHAAVSKGA